jgi:hypothetical protein
MFRCTRGGLVLVAAVVASLAAPAAAYGATPAPSTTVPSPPTTVPVTTTTQPRPPKPSPTTSVPAVTPPPGSTPPSSSPPISTPPPPPAMPAFTLPTNSGLELLQQMQQARLGMRAAQIGLGPASRDVVTARRRLAAARKEVRRLEGVERATERKLEQTRTLLHQAAAEAYIHAGDAKLLSVIDGVFDTNSIVDASAQLHMLGSFGDKESELLDEYLALKQQVDDQLAHIRDVEHRAERRLSAATKRLGDLRKTINGARTLMAVSMAGMHLFETAATSATSPILGPSRLTAKQMADYIVANHYHPNITVPIQVLAQIYLNEGTKTGVRGDVAFAQSILETAGFAHPGSAATNNNFAGIGWCDSCRHGFNFANATLGVRAQLQLLRIYVDPNFPEPDYKDPILLRGSLTLGFRGKVQTWWDLWGTWATGALYGQRVYDIYERMVAFSLHDPAAKRTPAKPAVKPAAKP